MEAAAQAYDGAPLRDGECTDPSWARCYPDWQALCADGRFERLAAGTYGPMLAWKEQLLQIEPLTPGTQDATV